MEGVLKVVATAPPEPLLVIRGLLLRGGKGTGGKEEGRNGCHILSKCLPYAIVMSTPSSLFAQRILPLGYLVPQFDVLFREKLLKIVATMRDFLA